MFDLVFTSLTTVVPMPANPVAIRCPSGLIFILKAKESWVKMCARWMSRTGFTSGLCTTENSGGPEFGLGDTEGEAKDSESVAGVWTALIDISGMGMEIGGLSVPEAALSIGGGERRRPLNKRRQNGLDVEAVGAVDAFRRFKGDVSVEAEALPAASFLLQSWQIFFRNLSSSA